MIALESSALLNFLESSVKLSGILEFFEDHQLVPESPRDCDREYKCKTVATARKLRSEETIFDLQACCHQHVSTLAPDHDQTTFPLAKDDGVLRGLIHSSTCRVRKQIAGDDVHGSSFTHSSLRIITAITRRGVHVTTCVDE